MIPPTLPTLHAGFVSSARVRQRFARGLGWEARRALFICTAAKRERTMIVAYLLVGLGCYLLIIRCVLALFEVGE